MGALGFDVVSLTNFVRKNPVGENLTEENNARAELVPRKRFECCLVKNFARKKPVGENLAEEKEYSLRLSFSNPRKVRISLSPRGRRAAMC